MVIMNPSQNIYNYDKAFSRNLGWLTIEEQHLLSKKRVAIAGLGGVGGHYAEALARLGISHFHLADFDSFEVHNFNRQNGSGMHSLNLKKAEIIKCRILDINPEATVVLFNEGIERDNIDAFLNDVDLYLDGLDFFVTDIRRLLFKELKKKKIIGLTVAPIGMGASLVVFDPQSMSFDSHFGIDDSDSSEHASVKFLLGLSPTLKQLKYLVDRKSSNFKEKRAPSLAIGPYLCAGIAGTEVIRILLSRSKRLASPWVLHFDAYLQTYHKTYLWRGHKNILQKIKLIFVIRMLNKMKNHD